MTEASGHLLLRPETHLIGPLVPSEADRIQIPRVPLALSGKILDTHVINEFAAQSPIKTLAFPCTETD